MRGARLALAVVALIACALVPTAGSRAPAAVSLIAVGDIADCDTEGDEATAALLDSLPGTIAALGDLAYESGSDEEFRRCYEPTWGRHRQRTRPALGNHEYGTPEAGGYFRYFGRAAGPARGYRSYDLGAWHVVVLNSNCAPAGGCAAGSPQERWLRADLARNRGRRCTLAYAHHPRFSSGLHGSDETLVDLWRALFAGGADLVLAGHDHHYERFAPQTPAGRRDVRRGIRQFVVGTGGRRLYPVLGTIPNSEVHDDRSHGVLALRLGARGYSWRFVPVAGGSFRDAGTGTCH